MNQPRITSVTGAEAKPGSMEAEIVKLLPIFGDKAKALASQWVEEQANDLASMNAALNAMSNVFLIEAITAMTRMLAGSMADDKTVAAAKEAIKASVHFNFDKQMREAREHWRSFNAQQENGGTA